MCFLFTKKKRTATAILLHVLANPSRPTEVGMWCGILLPRCVRTSESYSSLATPSPMDRRPKHEKPRKPRFLLSLAPSCNPTVPSEP